MGGVMKVAVPATAPDIEAEVHSSFGHCEGYLLVDTDTGEWEGVARPKESGPDCAGVAAARALVDRGVRVVLTTEIGEEAARVFRAAGAMVWTGVTGSIHKAIDRLLSDDLEWGPPPHPCAGDLSTPPRELTDAERALIAEVVGHTSPPRLPGAAAPGEVPTLLGPTSGARNPPAEYIAQPAAQPAQLVCQPAVASTLSSLPKSPGKRPRFLSGGFAIAVASGKGGTGKTTVAVSLALALGSRAQLLDCDVEDPNAHLFLLPRIAGGQRVVWPLPTIDAQLCDGCGACAESCRFHALAVVKGQVLVFPDLCRGCGVCFMACPRKAIKEENRELGDVRWGESRGLHYIGGELTIGQEMTGPVVWAVKERAVPDLVAVVDCPPGAGAPMIEALAGCDYCLLVTEPTAFGLSDLQLAVAVGRSLGLPMGVIVNRATEGGDSGIGEYCRRQGLPVLLTIPESRRIAELYSRGIPFLDEMPEWKMRLVELLERARAMADEDPAEVVTSDDQRAKEEPAGTA